MQVPSTPFTVHGFGLMWSKREKKNQINYEFIFLYKGKVNCLCNKRIYTSFKVFACKNYNKAKGKLKDIFILKVFFSLF